MTLVDLFPLDKGDAISRQEYNKRMAGHYEAVRDFIIAHYHLNARDDGALWRYCRAMDIPETLTEKLAMYRHRGKVLISPYEQFMLPSWVSILSGQDVHPEHIDPLVDAIVTDDAVKFFGKKPAGSGTSSTSCPGIAPLSPNTAPV